VEIVSAPPQSCLHSNSCNAKSHSPCTQPSTQASAVKEVHTLSDYNPPFIGVCHLFFIEPRSKSVKTLFQVQFFLL
jgi:hypothetical protein